MHSRGHETWPHGAIKQDPQNTRFSGEGDRCVLRQCRTGKWTVLADAASGRRLVSDQHPLPAGTRYRYNIESELEVPETASRAQAEDIDQYSEP